MNRYDKLYLQFSGAALIAAPLLLLCASLIKAAGIGSSTGRWYDSWLEAVVLYLGMSLLIVALLALSRIVGQRQPILGIIAAIFSVLGTAASFFPTVARYVGSNALAAGIPMDQLDILFGGSEVPTPDQSHVIGPFILLFFLNFLLLAFGLWRVNDAPRYTPILLVAGVVLFMVAQTPFEVIVVAYIASTVAWLLAMAPIGLAILRSNERIVFDEEKIVY
jgi:hypothetical protein